MFEELYAPLPDVQAYLDRIGLSDAKPEPTAQWLDTLVHHQLTHIPFDDLDVFALGICPSLAIEDLFKKIVIRRRGGYCYELNSLFCAFLKALGFSANVVIVHIVSGRDFVPIPSHCAIVVEIAGEQYFVDVGYGGPVPDGAVLMDGEVHKGYRVTDEGMHKLLSTEAGDRVMLFKNMPALPVELLPLNYHTSQTPGSPFRRIVSLNLRLEGGSVSFQNHHFKYSCNGELIEYDLSTADEVRQLMPKYFGMIPEEAPMRELEDK